MATVFMDDCPSRAHRVFAIPLSHLISTFLSLSPYTHPCTHSHTFTHVHTLTHIHTRSHTHAHTHTRSHVHTLMHSPMHTHTRTFGQAFSHFIQGLPPLAFIAVSTLQQKLLGHRNPCLCSLTFACFAPGSSATSYRLQVTSRDAPARGTCLRAAHFMKKRRNKLSTRDAGGIEPSTLELSE